MSVMGNITHWVKPALRTQCNAAMNFIERRAKSIYEFQKSLKQPKDTK